METLQKISMAIKESNGDEMVVLASSFAGIAWGIKSTKDLIKYPISSIFNSYLSMTLSVVGATTVSSMILRSQGKKAFAGLLFISGGYYLIKKFRNNEPDDYRPLISISYNNTIV